MVFDKVSAKTAATLFRKVIGMLAKGSKIGDRFQNERQIFKPNTFLKKILQDTLDEPNIN